MGEICASQHDLGVQLRRMEAYNEVANEDLHDLGLEAFPSTEDLLQNADEEVAERGANEGAVEGHLGDSRREVVAVLAPIMRDPRSEELLQAGQGAGREHFGAQRVLLQLLEIGLAGAPVSTFAHSTAANCAPLTARYPLTPPPLVRASPTSCSRSSLPLPLAATPAAFAMASDVVLTVSFSNFTDMAGALRRGSNGRRRRVGA